MGTDSRSLVYARSGGKCEALVALPRTWARCGRPVVEIHHMLKRSRGGHLLDPYDIYHLSALCRQHHHYAETSGDDTGLLIDGYVVTDSLTGLPIYTGSDEYLTEHYGPHTREQALEAGSSSRDRQGQPVAHS